MTNEKVGKKHPLRNNIWVLRKKMGLSQKELAYVIFHKTSSIVNRWEKGVSTPDSESFVKLTIALSVPLEAIWPKQYERWQIPILERRNETKRKQGNGVYESNQPLMK
ncbi:MAG: helix-turn-helix transcriptional regulator [bacterium]|nr:helix-turn-helix transcriptional regulator [bacterium]